MVYRWQLIAQQVPVEFAIPEQSKKDKASRLNKLSRGSRLFAVRMESWMRLIIK